MQAQEGRLAVLLCYCYLVRIFFFGQPVMTTPRKDLLHLLARRLHTGHTSLQVVVELGTFLGTFLFPRE